MRLGKFLILLLAIGVLLSLPIYAQQYYYYFDGQKFFVNQQHGQYVISFCEEATETEKENFLLKNDLKYEKEKLLSKYVLVESIKDKAELKNDMNTDVVKNITRLFTGAKIQTDFTFTNTVIVKKKHGVKKNQLFSLIHEYKPVKIEKEWLGERVLLFSVNTADELHTLEIANFIYESGLVEFSHPDFITFNWAESNDTYFNNQWNLTQINIPDAWNITTGNSSVIIAILDCGVQSDHPDLSENLVTGYDVVGGNDTTDPYNNFWHGTGCAGIASAVTNNNTGVAGVGYNCKIMPIQFTYDEWWGNSSNFAAGINWAWNNGAYVINISGNTNPADAVNNAINSATSEGRNEKGSVVVKSAGNRGNHDKKITYPGQRPKVMTVGATDQNDIRISYSSYGSALDVMAPSGVYSTDLTGNRGETSGDYIINNGFTGTSAAAPHVAGLAGLILSVDNTLDEALVRKMICYTCDDINLKGFDNETGWGRINANAAVKSAARQFTLSGTLTESQFLWGNVTLTGDVIVPANKYFAIHSDAIVNLNGHVVRSTGGIIVIEQGATVNGYQHYAKQGAYYKGLFPSSITITQIINWAFPGWAIYISPGTYTGNITMKPGVGVIGTGGGTTTINGTVTFNNTPGAGLSNVTVNNKITINHSDNVSLSNVTAGHANCWLDVSNSNMVSLNDFTSHVSRTQAAYAHNSSYLTLWHGSLKNKSDGIYIAGSSADLLHVELCQNNYDIAAIVSSVLAFKCFYSNSVPGSTIYNYNSTVDWFWWNACGGGGGGFPKGAGREEPETFDIEKDPDWESYREALEIWRDFTEAIREENKSEEKRPLSEYRSAAVLVTEPLKQIISQYSQSPLAVLSLSRLASLWLALESYEELETYMHALLQGKEKTILAPWAQNALASLSIRRHDYKKAVSIYDDLLKTLPEHDQAVEWLYSKAVLYKYHLDQPGTAEKLFRQIITDWPEHLTAQSAADELGQPSAQRSAHAAEQRGGMLVTEEFEFAASNYPNPFNPETMISFTLPEPGSVSVKVYDITGRQIRTLSEKDYTPGAHQLIWEGTDQRGLAVSSGVYFYRIEFEGRHITGKMLLVR